MIALDTNIIARVVLNDAPEQYDDALKALSADGAFISATVLLELFWVLRSIGELSEDEILSTVETLASRPNLTIVSPESSVEFIRLWRGGLEAEDAAHLAFAGDVAGFVTFDRQLVKRAKKLRSHLPVEIAGG
jgi:predicted nucleic acid-binding protein